MPPATCLEICFSQSGCWNPVALNQTNYNTLGVKYHSFLAWWRYAALRALFKLTGPICLIRTLRLKQYLICQHRCWVTQTAAVNIDSRWCFHSSWIMSVRCIWVKASRRICTSFLRTGDLRPQTATPDQNENMPHFIWSHTGQRSGFWGENLSFENSDHSNFVWSRLHNHTVCKTVQPFRRKPQVCVLFLLWLTETEGKIILHPKIQRKMWWRSR